MSKHCISISCSFLRQVAQISQQGFHSAFRKSPTPSWQRVQEEEGAMVSLLLPLFRLPLEGCHPHVCMNQVCNPPDQAGLLTSGLFPADVLRNESWTSYGHVVGWHSSLGISANRIPKPRPVTWSVFSIRTIAYVLKAIIAGQTRILSPSLENHTGPGSCPV